MTGRPSVKLDAEFHGDLTVEKLNDAIREVIAAGGSWRDAHAPVQPGLHMANRLDVAR